MLTTSNYDIEIQTITGAWRGLMLAPKRDNAGKILPGALKSVTETLGASESDQELQRRLTPIIQGDWSRGFGLDYSEAPGLYTRTPGYVLPAGAAFSTTLPAPNNGTSMVLAIEQHGGDVWLAQAGDGTVNHGRVMRSAAGTGVPTDSLPLLANRYVRDMIVFDDGNATPGAGVQNLFASTSNTSPLLPGANGSLSRWDGAIWTSTVDGITFGAKGRNGLAKAVWRTNDGVVAMRLMTISGKNTIAYTIPYVDIMTAAAWVEDVPIGTATGLLKLVASRRHIYCLANDGVFDLQEDGSAPNLVSYWGQMQNANNGTSGVILEDYLYASLGTGLDRIYLGDGPLLQETPGQCAPGWGTRAESQWRGSITCLTVDQGYLVAAVYNPSTGKSAIFYGKDRKTLGIDSPNPLIWYGPEVIIDADYVIRAMRVVNSSDGQFLWVAAVPLITPGNPIVFRVSVPIAGAPVQDLLSSGLHRFTTGGGYLTGGTIQPYSRLHLMPEYAEDRVAPKIIYQHGLATRGLEGTLIGTRMIIETAADPPPGTITWTTSDNVLDSPTTTITASTVVKGNSIERRILFFSPSGGATPPKIAILDALRTTVWVVAPATLVQTLEVEYGPGVFNREGVDEADDPTRDPDVITQEIRELGEYGRTVIRLPSGSRWTCRVMQAYASEVSWHEGEFGQSRSAQMVVSLLAKL